MAKISLGKLGGVLSRLNPIPLRRERKAHETAVESLTAQVHGRLLAQYPVGQAEVFVSHDGEVGYYEVSEPSLSEREREVYRDIFESFIYTLEPEAVEADNPARFVEGAIWKAAEDLGLLDEVRKGFAKYRYFIQRDLGYGKLHVPMADPDVQEITAVSYGRPVCVIHRKFANLGWLQTNIVFHSEEELQNYNLRLAQRFGGALTAAVPMADIMSPEGHRFSLTFGDEVTHPGSSFSVRRFPEKPFSLAYLVGQRMLSPLMAAYLWQVLEHRGFVQVLGHVSSGKTTLLGALLASIDPNAKIITLEDTMELRLPHENWQRFHTRPVHFASSERFEVKLFDLLRLVMRHRPDYVVVGETRGEEMRNLTHSASLGHSCACLPGDEMILYTQGERYELSPIGDFVENILRGKILNPRVFSFDPSGRVVESALKRVYKVPSSCTIEEIKIEGGKLFRASPNHPVLVLDRGKIVQKRADEVAKGDLIPVLLKLPKKETQSKIDIIELLKDTNIYIRLGPKAKNVAASKKSLLLNSGYSIYNVYDWVERGSAMPLEAYLLIEENERSIRENVEVQWGRKGKGRIPGIIPLNENFGKVLGYYLADGFCSSVVNFAFGKKKTQHSRDLIEALKKLKIPYSVLPSKAPGVTAGSKVLALVLERLVGTGSHEKRIPGFVFNAPEEFQKALIKAYWKTDGRIRIRGKNSLMCVATTVSRELAYGLQYLLKIFGVDTSLRLDENSVGFGRPKPIKFYKSYEIQVLGGNSLKKFAEIMNRNVKTSLSFAERGSILPGDDFYFGKVKDRREVPFDGEWLYDVETEHGNFLHSGTVFTHNSTFHAESPEAALARMRADPINLKDDDILRVWCFATAAQVRRPSGELVYRVMSIHEINPTEEGRPELSEVFRYDIRSDSFSPDSPREVVRRSRRLRESAEARGMGERELADELRRKVGFLEQLVKRRELGYEQYIQRIREFYATRGG